MEELKDTDFAHVFSFLTENGQIKKDLETPVNVCGGKQSFFIWSNIPWQQFTWCFTFFLWDVSVSRERRTCWSLAAVRIHQVFSEVDKYTGIPSVCPDRLRRSHHAATQVRLAKSHRCKNLEHINVGTSPKLFRFCFPADVWNVLSILVLANWQLSQSLLVLLVSGNSRPMTAFATPLSPVSDKTNSGCWLCPVSAHFRSMDFVHWSIDQLRKQMEKRWPPRDKWC